MKKALFKDSIKEIKNTYKRFLSILLMAFLGVGFFAGIRAVAPDMRDTINLYYKDKNVYDIKILSTLGLTNEDIEALEKIEGVEKVYGEYSQDVLLNFEDSEVVAKVMSLDTVNEVTLVEGRIPEKNNECLVEKSFCTFKGKKIGDTLKIETSDDNIITEKEVTIVGTVSSPLYITRERDSSKLGAGKVEYNIFMPKESFDSKIYTEIYVTLKDTETMHTNSDEYKEYVQTVTNKIEEIKEEREQARYNEIIDEANEKLEEAEQKLNDEKQNAQEKIENAEKELQDGKDKIKIATETLNKSKKQSEEEFEKYEEKIKNAKETIKQNENEFTEKEKQANSKIQELSQNKEQLQTGLNTLTSTISNLQAQYNEILKKLEDENLTQAEKTILEKNKEQLENNLKTLETQKSEIQTNIETIEGTIVTIENSIKLGKQELVDYKNEIEEQEKQLIQTKNETASKFEKAQKEINDNNKTLAESESKLEDAKKEYNTKIAEAESELINARDEISKIEKAKWYVLDRESNIGYNSLIQDAQSMENLGKVFPIVFFVIATLISLTSMTRMVEEQRVQIGTLKALGYNKIQIASKYLIYSSLACLVGGIIGMCIGFKLLPDIVWMMYSMMYTMPNIVISFNWYYAILGLGLAFICIVGATFLTTVGSLRSTPAELMRPKAPKPGKRILLEKIPFIWNKLNFSQKVTIRNIFRYKKRVLMTIIGIAGSTALILTGFGVKDSVTAIMPNQFEKIFNYDIQISLKSDLKEEELNNFVSYLSEKEKINNVVEAYATTATLVNGKNEENVQVIVPKDEKIKDIIKIKDIKTEEEIELSKEKIAITDKVAQLLNLKKGDTVTFRDTNNKEIQLEIADVVENYVYHYVYMSKELYEKIYEKYETNLIYLQSNANEEEQKNLSKELLERSEVNSVTQISSMISMIDDMMSCLNYVVVILIVSAGLLAFVVLYNLANVNISERIRELATIKVLGFYDNEVYKYVARETIILTIIGIILGLIGGYCLNYFIMGTCEINILRFTKDIHFISYVYSVLLTVLFTLIVNVVTYFALKKIDMIESLKSIE